MIFIDMIKPIQAMACGIAKHWNYKFDVDELVNEAWIRSLRYDFSDVPLIMRRAKMDMIDYIRKQMGRRKYNLKFITNADEVLCIADNERHGDHYLSGRSIFDVPHEDKNLLGMEQKELIKLLLTNPTPQQLAIMFHYYFDEMTLKETARLIGKSEPRISCVVRDGLERCREGAQKLELGDVWLK